MENSNLLNAELNPTNGEENNNNNLQNNSGESTQNENVEKQKPKHFSGLFDMTPEEEERRTQEEEDRELWERINEPEHDPNIRERKSDGDEISPDANNDQDKDSDSKKKIRVSKDSNTRLAGLIRIKSQKKVKYDRLMREMKNLKADQKRGYRIVENKDGQKEHIPIDSAEDLVLSLKISDKDNERTRLRIEIASIDQNIKSLAGKKLLNSRLDKEKAKASMQQDNLVKRVIKELDAASKNGGKVIVARIQQEVQAGNKDDAYKSLKSFLSENVKTVSKKLSKSKELESSVLGRVLDKQSSAQ